MLTLSVLAAESQAVLRLGGSRVMVINNVDKKKNRKKEREMPGQGGGERAVARIQVINMLALTKKKSQ